MKHIAFCVEQAYGHIMPTLGIAMELMRRGHQVSYAVSESFAPLVRRIGATAVTLDVAENRDKVIGAAMKENDHLNYRVDKQELTELMARVTVERTERCRVQLEKSYRGNRPDLIVHDDCLNTAGREFATRWGIARALHCPQFIQGNLHEICREEELVLISVPKFFHRLEGQEPLPSRYKFIGFVPEGRCLAFRPWQVLSSPLPQILISPTTGLLQQLEFCRQMIAIMRNQPWLVVLSISGSHDALSAIDPTVFDELPSNILLNHASSNFDILSSMTLFIGQGGQGATLESIYYGVPQIVLPPTPHHYAVARRVGELGLGVCLPMLELSADGLIGAVAALLEDKSTRERVREAGASMQNCHGGELAADILENHLAGRH